MSIPSLTLASGDALPQVGLGLWKIDPADVSTVVRESVTAGYRHFDSAADYGNEEAVGEALSSVIDEGLCSRDELWITSKLWNTYHAQEHVRPALERTLRDLRVDSLDLYLVHFPISLAFVPFETRYPPGWFFDPEAASPGMKSAAIPFRETWGAMEELIDAGLVKNIGVCNVGCMLLRDLLATARIRPSVLQIERHPYLVQQKLLRFCEQEGIAVTGFSPLGSLSYVSLGMAGESDNVLNEPCIREAAAAHDRTPAQVVLRWGVQSGTAIVPKSSNPDRLRENIALFDFELTEDEMHAIDALDQHRRFNDPGDFCESAFNTFFPIYE